MTKRKAVGGKPTPLQALRTDAEIEQMIDRLEQAMHTEDQALAQSVMTELWHVRRRLPDILTQRLLCNRSRVPALDFEILCGFAGRRATAYLRQIAGDQSVMDIVRFGAQRRLGWPSRGEAKRRQTFLEALSDPDATLIQAIDQGSSVWPPESDILREVLAYLNVLSLERRQNVVANAAQQLGARSAWLLHALLHTDDPTTQYLAIAELVRLRDRGSISPLNRLASTTQRAKLRVEATAAARRLSLQVVDHSTPAPFPPLPPVERAFLTAVDGDGGQMMIVVRRWVAGAYLVAHFLTRDDWGVRDALGTNRATDSWLEDTLARFKDEGIDLVEVDVAALRGALSRAVEINATTGRGIPPVFEFWEPLAHESYPPAADERSVLPELDDAPQAGRKDLIQASDHLIEHRFFSSWLFHYTAAVLTVLAVEPSSARGLTERTYQALIEQSMDTAMRDQLRQRLHRQAWLLAQIGDASASDQALAIAAALNNASLAELAKVRFFQQMAERGLLSVLSAMPFQ